MSKESRRHTGAEFGKTTGDSIRGLDAPMIGAASSIAVDAITERESGITPPPPPISVKALAIVFSVMFLVGIAVLWLLTGRG